MIKLIEQYLCKQRNVTPEQIRERHPNGKLLRRREYVISRQLIVYYALMNGYTEREAGDYFDGQDHSTAHYAKKKIHDLCDVYPDFRFDISEYDKALLGLRGLTDKKLVERLKYTDEEKVKYIQGALAEIDSQSDRLTARLDNIKLIIFALKNPGTGTTDGVSVH